MVTVQGKNADDVRQMVAEEGGSPELAERLLPPLVGRSFGLRRGFAG